MLSRLAEIPNLLVSRDVPLALHTRFGIGGPADIFAETASVEAFVAAWQLTRDSSVVVLGAGTNLVVADEGFRGVVLRFTADRILAAGDRVMVDAGAVLQDLVNFNIDRGLAGTETLTGIPGWVGAAIYGNAGAYGHSINERILRVRFFDGREVRVCDNAACEFRYRSSRFKQHKDWIILSAELQMEPGDAEALSSAAAEILKVRNAKYPPTMKCAGSIFKNCLLDQLPESARSRVPATVVREGKVPSAWFLEQVGAKGMADGDIRVADYHANLIYNAGAGTARAICAIIDELKQRVLADFGLALEEEVQYVGFADRVSR